MVALNSREKCFNNEKVPELSKEFGDVFRFWLAPIPTAAEAPELDLRPDDGVLLHLSGTESLRSILLAAVFNI